MAKESLREHLNRKIKEKGSTLSKEKAKAKKYKSIAAAKKAGSLYYTNKAGKVMAAVYATDLALKSSLKPKLRPTVKKPTPKPDPKFKPSAPSQPSGGRPKTGPKVVNKNKNPDELSTQAFDSVKRTDRKGVTLTRKELEQMSKYYPRKRK